MKISKTRNNFTIKPARNQMSNVQIKANSANEAKQNNRKQSIRLLLRQH